MNDATDHHVEFTDSGIEYCIVHHGIVDVDQASCDFAPRYADDCVTRRLFYAK